MQVIMSMQARYKEGSEQFNRVKSLAKEMKRLKGLKSSDAVQLSSTLRKIAETMHQILKDDEE